MCKNSSKYSLIKIVSLLVVFFSFSVTLGYAEISEKSYLDRILEENELKVELQKIPEGNLYIPKNTSFEVALGRDISSKKSKKGESVDIIMVENLIINDVIVIPKGTIGTAVITNSRKNGFFGRSGKLELAPQSITTLNGIKIPLTNNLQSAGKSDGGAVVVGAAVSLVGGFFMKGTNIYHPAGTKITVIVPDHIDLKVTNENIQEKMNSAKPQGQEIIIN